MATEILGPEPKNVSNPSETLCASLDFGYRMFMLHEPYAETWNLSLDCGLTAQDSRRSDFPPL
jgi:hypothetical protein